ncbi:MAG: chorismate dehydratase [Rhodothermales bacterium]|jgi:chorismate dehydratase
MKTENMLRISLWDDHRLKALGAALESEETEVVFADRLQCEKRLLSGLTDLAMIPSHRALAAAEDFEVLPAVAYSSWCTPHALISLRGGFAEKADTIQVPDVGSVESLVARVVLKEHYGLSVTVGLLETAAALSDHAAVLAVDEPAPAHDGLVLDLGQEWFELTNYPMVWGLFLMRKGELDARTIRILRDGVSSIETADHLDGTDPGADGLALPRLRLDDLAVASLTELATYLYYYGVTKDIEEVTLGELPEDSFVGDDDGREPLL